MFLPNSFTDGLLRLEYLGGLLRLGDLRLGLGDLRLGLGDLRLGLGDLRLDPNPGAATYLRPTP
jgi:hypothetical protein